MADLLALTADLVGIPSVSHDEGAITERLQNDLDAAPWLTVDRLGTTSSRARTSDGHCAS